MTDAELQEISERHYNDHVTGTWIDADTILMHKDRHELLLHIAELQVNEQLIYKIQQSEQIKKLQSRLDRIVRYSIKQLSVAHWERIKSIAYGEDQK